MIFFAIQVPVWLLMINYDSILIYLSCCQLIMKNNVSYLV